LYLSGEDEELMIGNFITDFIRGNQKRDYNSNIQEGIKLHRIIDTFTDHHPIFIQGRERLKNYYGLHSGIVMDIFYDHFLAVNWEKYSKKPLNRYIRETYVMFVYNYSLLPLRVKKILPLFIVKNWIGMYPYIDGIYAVLERMSQRTSLPPKTKEAIQTLEHYYHLYNEEFSVFFKEMQIEIQPFLNRYYSK
ncbi:MAG: DUF479 domain-containing protein, partial [Marinilabiliales bacterium]